MSRASKNCELCGVSYERHKRFDRSQWAASRFCSRKCSGANAKIQNRIKAGSLREKFDALFSRGPGCWEWKGPIDGYGYGIIGHNCRRYRAHVLALEYDDRAVPEGGVACHHCDNPRCVRPSHLYPGTPADNVHDAQSRGRLAAGERIGSAKLTPSQVLEMRSLNLSFADLGRRFGVSRTAASLAVKGVTWKHVT